MESIAWFRELNQNDTRVAGGKGANLGELTAAGFNVPPGFVVTAPAYLAAMQAAGVREMLAHAIDGLDPDDTTELSRRANESAGLVRKAALTPDIRAAITGAFNQIVDRDNATWFAVRSSATAEDTAGTSFAGMNKTFTNVAGADGILDAVVECWASLFAERVLAYRSVNQLFEEPAIAVIVQEMVDSERSGVIFTADPATGDRTRMLIEAAWGQGEVIVSGQVEPDSYVVDPARNTIISVHQGTQREQIRRDEHGVERRIPVSTQQANQRVLDDEEVLAVARLAAAIAAHYGQPQDVEWAMADTATYIVQSRPITTIKPTSTPASTLPDDRVLLRGLGASAGTATGRVRVLHSPAQGGFLQPGEVLVGHHDEPRLGSRAASRRGRDYRRRGAHLSRCHRQPRTSGPVCSGSQNRHRRPA